jgi:hypothetical protein
MGEGVNPVNSRVYRNRVERETYNGSNFEVKLAAEFIDAKLIICITSPVKLGGVKICPKIRY